MMVMRRGRMVKKPILVKLKVINIINGKKSGAIE